jgi:hypothetical protein
MNKPKHTPGPWTYEEEAYHMDQVFGPKGLIAQVIGDSAETCANAYLISAAPDLLAALKLLILSWENIDYHDWQDNISIAKEAIAKAEKDDA